MDTEQKTLMVTCPQCGDVKERYEIVLEIMVCGCPKCKCFWKHELMVAKELRESTSN